MVDTLQKKKTLSVDFDGTIVEHAFPRIGKLKPGVIEALEKLSKKYFILVCSCRNNPELNSSKRYYSEMVRFLRDNKVPHDGVDDGSSGKPVAEFYIDDRGIRFNDNWPEIAEALTA